MFGVLSFLPAVCFSQPLDSAWVGRLSVSGNDRTRSSIILRELELQPGSPFVLTTLEGDQNRLYNLGIFEQVLIVPDQNDSGSVDLLVEVVESIPYIPVPLVYFQDEIGWSYGGGVSYLNFRGRNQRLMLAAATGGEDTWLLHFFDPWLLGPRIGLNASFIRAYRGHPAYSNRFKITTVQAGLSLWWERKTKFGQASMSWEQRGWSDSSGTDFRAKSIRGRVEYMGRFTDIWRDPTQGGSLRITVRPLIALNGELDHNISGELQGSLFRSLGSSLVLGVNAEARRWAETPPMWWQTLMGGAVVRGYDIDPQQSSRISPGRLISTNYIGANVELRRPLIRRALVDGVELGLSGVLFYDVAIGYEIDEHPFKLAPLTGYGAGLRIFMPVVDVLAIDLGANPHDSKLHWRIQIGQRF